MGTITRIKKIVIMISDFFDAHSYEKPMKILNSRHDLIAVRVLDKTELELPSMPMLELEDSESGETVFFDASSASMRNDYANAAAEGLEEEVETFNRAKVDLVDLRCDEDMVRPLMAFFRNRKLKRG